MFRYVVFFFMLLVDPLGFIWRAFREPKGEIKLPFSPDAPRSVPGRDSGSILGGFGRYFECIFGFVFNDFLVLL